MTTNRITSLIATMAFLAVAGAASAKEKGGGAGMAEYKKGNEFFEKKQYPEAANAFHLGDQSRSQTAGFL